MPRRLFHRKKKIAVLLICALGASVFLARLPQRPAPAPPEFRVELGNPGGLDAVGTLNLTEAISHGLVRGRFESNGHDRLRVSILNLREETFAVRIPEGLVFEAGENQVVSVRSTEMQLAPGLELGQEIATAATRLTNHQGFQPSLLTGGSISRLAVLLPFVQKHPELSLPAVQTAVLALTENPPLSSFARFPLLVPGDSVLEENPVFKVATVHILQALQMLKDIGYPQDRLALTVDPQLQAEAMVDPLGHAAALKYYEIPPQKEYAYWQNLLVNGHESLRHYALHGIARYYPEVALQMLPKWARTTKLDNVTRSAAIRSLAGAPRPETIPVLEHLSWEFHDPELAAAASETLFVVRQAVYDPARFRLPIEFRHTLPPPLEVHTEGM